MTKIRGVEIPAGTHIRITNSIDQSDDLRAYYLASTTYDNFMQALTYADLVTGLDTNNSDLKWSFMEVAKKFIKNAGPDLLKQSYEDQVKAFAEKLQTNPNEVLNEMKTALVDNVLWNSIETAANTIAKITTLAVSPGLEKAVGIAFDIAGTLNLARTLRDTEKYKDDKPIHYYFYEKKD